MGRIADTSQMAHTTGTDGDVMFGIAAFALFAATIPAANYVIGNVGVQLLEGGPHLIPVGFGLMAPSGVMMVGAALVLRDIVHERLGAGWALAAIAIGGGLSWWFAPPALVLASVLAFTLSELADFAVYSPLRKKRLGLAVALSGLVGSAIDSAVFLWLAFGSLSFIEGQVVGKLWMSLIAFAVISAMRLRTSVA